MARDMVSVREPTARDLCHFCDPYGLFMPVIRHHYLAVYGMWGIQFNKEIQRHMLCAFIHYVTDIIHLNICLLMLSHTFILQIQYLHMFSFILSFIQKSFHSFITQYLINIQTSKQSLSPGFN